MRRFLAAFMLALALAGGSSRAATGDRFVAIAFHDVVDANPAGDAVTTDRLVAFLEWVKASGMTPVTLDDIESARAGRKPLPPGAILITFDDGYRSLYERVYPLLLAYRIPVVAALVGEWVDAPMDARVRYDDRDVPRRGFVSWDEAREMQRSGLVEFASHSYALHRGIRANPQGSERPSATALAFSPGAGYESEAEHQARLARDFAKAIALHRRELGRAPRALVWPFGRYRGDGVEIAKRAGFAVTITLDPEPASASMPARIPRYWPSGNPSLADMVAELRFARPLAPAQSIACLDPASLAGLEFEKRLDGAIERLVRLGATAIILDPFVRDAAGRPVEAWFPSSNLPVRSDILSRIAWQMHRRAGVQVFVRLPPAQGNFDAARVAGDLATRVPVQGVFVEAPGALARGAPDEPGSPWLVRARRQTLAREDLPPDEAAIHAAILAMEREQPGIRVALVAPAAGPAASIADVTLFRPGDFSETAAAGRRTGLWIEEAEAGAIAGLARRARARGASAIGWCPDDPAKDLPASSILAPAVSSAASPGGR